MKCHLYILIISFLGIVSVTSSQEELIYTKSFTQKVAYHSIDFYQPVEQWFHVTNKYSDNYMDYDLVLNDRKNIEVRVRIIESSKVFAKHPHIEVMRMIATMATNDENTSIKISQMNPEWVAEQYGADWGLFADFVPKRDFDTHSKGRVLCIYKEGRALVNYIVLYEDELDPYFEMPLAFK